MTTSPIPGKNIGLEGRRRGIPHSTIFSGTIFRLRPRVEWMEDRTLLSTFLVSNAADSGLGSLRQAILDSNAATGATNVIDFAIAGSGVQAITPLTPLPTITDPVLIDGFSQPGYADTPLIEINGTQAGGGGLEITAQDVTVRGFDINNFPLAGIELTGTGATGDWIYGNLLGTDPTGTQAEPNAYGIEIDSGASGNLIGTNGDGVDDAAERNVISGNYLYGVAIFDQGTDGNIVAGNDIGTDVTASNALANASAGVLIDDATSNWIGVNPIGGLAVADEGNVISANGGQGIVLEYGANSNVVAGNRIGTDVSGVSPLPNSGDGIDILGGSNDNTIGGTVAGAGNLITDNTGVGVAIEDTSVGDAILENSTYGNTGQAIDLNDDGETPNSTVPRQGPNDLQDFPIIVTTAGGQLEGWLGGSTPNTTFHVDVFASSSSNADGSGEAEDYLGSMEVTTGATGQVSFAVPFTAPAGLPIVTATATDPQGNTSEVSAQRRGSVETPSSSPRAVPDEPLILSAASGDALAIQDPDAGPLDPLWTMTLSVSAGTLTLSTTAELIGSGDGTGSLSYNGPLSALNAALDGMTYTPPAGPHVFAMVELDAQSNGAKAVESQLTISDGVFVVCTTADSGPGSLRQAILNSNATPGITNTIDFAISGSGVQSISPLSPLPTITQAVQIDGESQPGYSGTPLIDLSGSQDGNADRLTISGAEVTVMGVADGRFGFGTGGPLNVLTLQSVSLGEARGSAGSFQFDTATGEELSAVIHAGAGLTTRLSLTDDQGHVLMTSDGQSAQDGDDLIQLFVPAGSFVLDVQDLGGAGPYSLTAVLAPANQPLEPIPLGNPAVSQNVPPGQDVVAADFNDDGHLDLAVADPLTDTVSVLLGNGDGTFQPPVSYDVGSSPSAVVAGEFTDSGHIDLAVANEYTETVSVLLGNGDGTFQPAMNYALSIAPMALAAADFTGDGKLDLVVAGSSEDYNPTGGYVEILMGNGDGTFQPPVEYAAGDAPVALVADQFSGNGKLDLAVVDEGDEQIGGADPGGVSILMSNGNGTFQPATEYAAGTSPGAIVAGDFTGDGILDLAVADEGGLVNFSDSTSSPGSVSVLLGNGDGSFRSSATYSVGVYPDAIVPGDFTGDGHLDLAIANNGSSTVSILLGNGDGTFQVSAIDEVALNPSSIAAGDFNGDGNLDLAVASQVEDSVTLLLGRGDGTFLPLIPAGNPAGPSPYALVAGDFTGNGRTDLVARDTGQTTATLLGNGDGTFQSPLLSTVGEGPNTNLDGESIAQGDFNGDGNLDVAVANQGSNTISILLGDGDGTFQPAVTYEVGEEPSAIVAGDFTGNGILDLAVANWQDDTISVLLGNGDGSFQPQVTYPVGSTPDAIFAGDFSGNGIDDLAVVNLNPNGSGGSVSILMGNGDGTFQPQVTYPVGSEPDAIVAGDFSGNGHLDLAVVEHRQRNRRFCVRVAGRRRRDLSARGQLSDRFLPRGHRCRRLRG